MSNLWFAAQKQNWDFAAFEVDETRNRIRWTLRISPTRKTPDGSILDMVGLLIAFPGMSLVYKSGVPDVDVNKVRIEIPTEQAPPEGDILNDLGGKSNAPATPAPDATPKTQEEKANDDLLKSFGGK